MKKIFLFFITFFAAFGGNFTFSAVTPYGTAHKTGVFADSVNIMYDRQLFKDKMGYAKLYSILNHPAIPSVELDSYVFKGQDMKELKTILALNADFTTATVAGAAATMTLVQDDKYHITKNMILKFDYTPDSGYTNEVYVYDRNDGEVSATNDRTTISVKPIDPTLKIGKGSGYTGYNTNFPRIQVNGTWYDDNSGTHNPAQTNPFNIYNYVQFQKTNYRYGELAAKQNLYFKGGLKWLRDDQAKNNHLKLMQRTMLFGGTRYIKQISLPTEGDEFSKMYGLEDWILAESPANKLYTSSIGSGLIDDFEEWIWGMASPDLEKVAGKRLALVNNALIKWLTDMKTQKQGIELAPNTAWGIPGVTTARWGTFELDLFVESAIQENYNTITEPYAMALTPTMIKIGKMKPTTLRANCQNNNISGYESVYETAWTYILHNAATAYHSVFKKAS